MLLKIIKSFFKFFNIGILKYSKLIEMEGEIINLNKILIKNNFLKVFKKNKLINKILLYINNKKTKSDLFQDIYVLIKNKFKKNGYFIEFGACDGILASNTYLLEKVFKWKGILCEPGKIWHQDLQTNRKCDIDYSCIYKNSNKLIDFRQTSTPNLSTINKYSFTDKLSIYRKSGASIYKVRTISLNDLLKKFKAPKIIDYISIDTEGSEYEILKNFNFNKYHVKVITCEHAFTSNRKKIFKLLTSKGYKREYPDLSKYDDWYFKK
jgi:FkbM family methyltransferase